MTTFSALLLTIVIFGFVVYPLFKNKLRPSSAGEENGKLLELRSTRDTTYSMLKELEFDYQSGILTEEDYRELEGRYKQKAISTLVDIDKAASGEQTGSDDEIEKQVKKLRRDRKTMPANDNDIEQEVKRLRQNKLATQPAGKSLQRNFCTHCGARILEDDKFCGGCGVKLNLGASSE